MAKKSKSAAKRVKAAQAKITDLTNRGFKLNPKHASAFTVNAMGQSGGQAAGRVGAHGTSQRAGEMAESDALFNPGPRKKKK